MDDSETMATALRVLADLIASSDGLAGLETPGEITTWATLPPGWRDPLLAGIKAATTSPMDA